MEIVAITGRQSLADIPGADLERLAMHDLPVDEPLTAATRDFVAAAVIEGELSDSVTGTLLAPLLERTPD